MLLELDQSTTSATTQAVRRKQTWGLDLAGQSGASQGRGPGGLSAAIESAGGIGGLLAILDTNGTTQAGQGPGGDPLADDRSLALLYDANGNVGQLLELTAGASQGAVAAKYEYDAYGNRANTPASGEYEQPWRFSTKWLDGESGLSYYGYRYYSARMGRWVSRDPIGEQAGLSRFAFVSNDPVQTVDSIGLFPQGGELPVLPGSGGRPLPPANASLGCCGPDISRELLDALNRFEANFNAATPLQQGRMCGSMVSGTGWDIDQLFHSGESGGFAGFQSNGCGTGGCAGTVQVFGWCMRSAEVNYILWGRALKLCRDSMKNWSVPFAKIEDTVNWIDSDGHVFPETRFDADCTLIYGWRLFGAPFQNITPNAIGAGSAGCRCAWMNFGDSGDLSGLHSCEVNGCGTGCCRQRYHDSLTGYAGEFGKRIWF